MSQLPATISVSPRNQHRAAFTLIEVLIALGLSVMLIFSVYSAITMYYRFNVAGRGEISGQQFLRGLTLRITDDIQSMVFRIPEAGAATSSTTSGQAASESTSSGSATSSASSTSSTSSTSTSSTSSASETDPFSENSAATASSAGAAFAGLTEAGAPNLFGLVGTVDLLHLCVSQPTRELAYASVVDKANGDERSSDIQVITYGLVTIDAANMALMQKNLPVTRPDQGLGRRVRDQFSLNAADETLSFQDLLAAEVTELSFLYFDGTDWVDNWDSLAAGSLPRAVQMSFGIWNPPPLRLGQARSQGTGLVTHVSQIFYLPISQPAVEAAQ